MDNPPPTPFAAPGSTTPAPAPDPDHRPPAARPEPDSQTSPQSPRSPSRPHPAPHADHPSASPDSEPARFGWKDHNPASRAGSADQTTPTPQTTSGSTPIPT